MLKTISAALLAASVFAAPVLAANTVKSSVTKSATVTPSAKMKKNPLDANAKMGRHHVSHHRHHRHHHKVAAKFHKSLKVSAKPVTHPAKRG
jgi:Ni/Co efflux regulator RcnB